MPSANSALAARRSLACWTHCLYLAFRESHSRICFVMFFWIAEATERACGEVSFLISLPKDLSASLTLADCVISPTSKPLAMVAPALYMSL